MNGIARRASILAGLAVATALSASPSVAARPAPRSAFDGSWSVSIITTSGACDQGYRYRIRIANGKVGYDDSNGIPLDVSGRVNPRGQISVTVGSGDKKASGTGRLSGDTGSGRWSGQSSSQQCSGRWEAERRE